VREELEQRTNENINKIRESSNLLPVVKKHEHKIKKIEELLQDVAIEKDSVGLQVSQV